MVRLGSQFADLSTALATPAGPGLDPGRVVRFAVRSIPHTEHCGLTLLRPQHPPRTLNATDDLPLRVDELQYALREGPCLDAATDGDDIAVTGALEADERWPVFGPRCAQEIGVHSMLSVRLAVASGDRAAMNFYATGPDAFVDSDVAVASIYAPFAALAVEHTLREADTENFRAALTSSRQIGTAIGIIMARHLVTSDQAFEILRHASQDLNRKLRDIAAEVEATGEVPDTDSAAPSAGAGPDVPEIGLQAEGG